MTYADSWQHETDVIHSGRRRGSELGLPTATPTTIATLSMLAAAVQAKATVEVGTGVGITGLQILTSMTPEGVLTTIDADANHQSAARETFREAGIDVGRARLITGQPAEVLPRLADGAYDLVVINDYGNRPGFYLQQALRLLRVGGAVAIDSALGKGASVTDPARREADVVALRDLSDEIKEHESLVSVLLPLGDGLLVAIKHTA